MRFVFLDHVPPELPQKNIRSSKRHFDLMFEVHVADEPKVLSTYAVDSIPNTSVSIRVEHLADHRIEYLNYEGEISLGRGKVFRYAWGDYTGELPSQSDAAAGLRLSFAADSKHFANEVWLLQIRDDQLQRYDVRRDDVRRRDLRRRDHDAG